MGRHASAFAVVRAACQAAWKRPPTDREAVAVLMVCGHETSYGRGWDLASARAKGWDVAGAVASHNWGAVQLARGQAGPSFAWGDSDPDTGAYPARFRSYPSDLAGAEDVARILANRRLGPTRKGPTWTEALASGSTDALSAYMWCSGYYGSAGASVAARIENYAAPLQAIQDAASADGVPAVWSRGELGDVSYRLTLKGRIAPPWEPESNLRPGWVSVGGSSPLVPVLLALGLAVGSWFGWKAGWFGA